MGSGDVAGRIIVIFKIKSNVKFTESFEVMTGEGELNFTSGKVETTHDCTDPWIHMVPFTTSVTTDLIIDPCEENIVKMMYGPISTMCTLSETSDAIGSDCNRIMVGTAFSGAVICNQIAFLDLYDMMSDRIFIERGLENKNPVVLDESFQKSNAAFTVTYTVKVEHKPL